MVPSVVSFRSVVALIDRFPVLAGLDFEVRAGEVVVLRGENGAGKTSLLRAIAGLLPIKQGHAEVFGLDIAENIKQLRRRIGLLTHQSLLYGELTVKENLEFAVRVRGGDVTTVRPAMQRMGIDGRLEHVLLDRLSAGQRRRTALASLIARDPELWLLDEPYTGLDAATRAELDAVLAESARHGHTIVFSSHEPIDSEILTCREVTISGGSVVSTASTETPGAAGARK